MPKLPEKQLLRRGEVLGGTGWTRGQFKKFEEAGLLKGKKMTKKARKLYYRCQVVKIQTDIEKGEL